MALWTNTKRIICGIRKTEGERRMLWGRDEVFGKQCDTRKRENVLRWYMLTWKNGEDKGHVGVGKGKAKIKEKTGKRMSDTVDKKWQNREHWQMTECGGRIIIHSKVYRSVVPLCRVFTRLHVCVVPSGYYSSLYIRVPQDSISSPTHLLISKSMTPAELKDHLLIFLVS